MKRLIAVFCLVAFLLSFVACSNTPVQSTEVTATEPTAAIQHPSDDAVSPLQAYFAPWSGDVAAGAVADGMLHYYFMSGKGMLTNYDSGDPYKWGDSTLIVFPNGQTMLIDVGVEAYAPVLAENLSRMGVDSIDYLMVSHPHSDHFGGIISENSFLDMISVGAVLYSGINRGEKSDLFFTRCADRNISVQLVQMGDVMEFGDVRMEILWPAASSGEELTTTAAINNASIVARFDFGGHSSLFAGDLYAKGEAAVITQCVDKLDVDLLKVPHHGLSTSSTGMFIYATSPCLAVAMSGFSYVIQRSYESKGATFLYDRYEGYIHIMTDGTAMTYETDRNQ